MPVVQCLIADSKNIGVVLDSIHALYEDGVRIFLLEGAIGLGKTFLVASYARRLGLDGVSSPSFSFMQEYRGLDFCIHHYDFYLQDYEARQWEFIESIGKPGVHFVEWGSLDMASRLASLGFDSVLISLEEVPLGRSYEFRHFRS